MIWRSTAHILVAFLGASLAVWFGPELLDLFGLGEFAFLGQLCLAVLALSVLRRLPGSHHAEDP
jgi:hypothetical protein